MVQAPIFHVNGDDPEAVVARGRAGLRVPAALQARRRDRPGRLPALGPQRDGRAQLHPAAHVRQDQEPHARSRSSTASTSCARASLTREELDRALGGEEGPDAARRARPARSPRSRGAPRSRPPPVDASAMWGRVARHAQGPEHGARGVRDPSQADAASSRSAAELLEGKGEADWATAEAAGLGHAAARGRARAPERAGLRPRHVQPAPRRLLRRAHGQGVRAPADRWPRRACASRSTTACSRKRR